MSETKESMQTAQLEDLATTMFTKLEQRLSGKIDELASTWDRKFSSLAQDTPGAASPPTPTQETPRQEAFHLNDYGVQLYYRNQLDQAAQSLEDAVAVQPELTEAWNNLGVVYTALNRPEKAIYAFQSAAELDPNRTEYLNNQGVLALLDTKVEKALELFEEAKITKDREVSVLLNLAQAYLALSYHERAVQTWKMVLAIDPYQIEANQNLRQYYP